MNEKLLFVVNCPSYFVSHRLPLAVKAMECGFDVHVAAQSGKGVERLRSEGVTFHPLPLTRSGRNIFFEMYLFFSICFLFYRLKPSVVHLITIKPIIYGGVAARLLRIRGVVTAIPGLGYTFSSSQRILSRLVLQCYKYVFKKENLLAIFQNPTDKNSLIEWCGLEESKSILIRGAGIDVNSFSVTNEPDYPVVIMVARLLWDKGVGEFVEAARILSELGVDAQFKLVGDIDPDNPASLSSSDIDELRVLGCVELNGYSDNIPNLLSGSTIAVLPSYREGLPKTLIEASAAGLPIVTTDVPGCRDAIEKDITGLLVPVKNAKALACSIKTLLDDPSLRIKMGKAGRDLAIREFEIKDVVDKHMKLYAQLLDGVAR